MILPIGLLLASLLFFVLYFLAKRNGKANASPKTAPIQEIIEKPSYGLVRIFFGSQTGTAAKLAEQLAEESREYGFQPEIVDLKAIEFRHLETPFDLSIFLLSNTGEGDPPENALKFVRVLKGKESLHEEKYISWDKVYYTVFGLGNTQYEHFNRTGKEVDALLEKNKAHRVHRIGLGDDNANLEDDFMDWRKTLWETLVAFRKQHPLKTDAPMNTFRKKSDTISEHSFKGQTQPLLANYRLVYRGGEIAQDELDFKTKESLKATLGKIHSIRQLRQNTQDGSTLQLQIELPGQPEYQTAGNISLYGRNDPQIVQEVIEYFKISEQRLQSLVSVEKLIETVQIKISFVPSRKLIDILFESIDLQGKVTKSTLKKLAKFKSKDPQYFLINSNVKTTEEYKKISQGKQEMVSLFKLVSRFKVEMCLEDFFQLSSSMAPRLFTIASHCKTQKEVVIAASIVENGLISKYFLSHPNNIRAELKKSTFNEAMKWRKVIFVAAGTGFAPFRGYLQEKEYLLRMKQPVPLVSMYFGCKHAEGDFIYREQISKWREQEVINHLEVAFSRDSQKKVYVQDMLASQIEELKQFIKSEDEAVYVCGSLGMGQAIKQLLASVAGAERLKVLEDTGRIIKELW